MASPRFAKEQVRKEPEPWFRVPADRPGQFPGAGFRSLPLDQDAAKANPCFGGLRSAVQGISKTAFGGPLVLADARPEFADARAWVHTILDRWRNEQFVQHTRHHQDLWIRGKQRQGALHESRGRHRLPPLSQDRCHGAPPAEHNGIGLALGILPLQDVDQLQRDAEM
jgi:hypothetical protein